MLRMAHGMKTFYITHLMPSYYPRIINKQHFKGEGTIRSHLFVESKEQNKLKNKTKPEA